MRNLLLKRWQVTRPSLVFSAGILRKFSPAGGKVYAGKLMTKLQEVERFQAAGVATPATALWRAHASYSQDVWGERVIVKPLRGLRGSGIQLLATADLGRLWAGLTEGGRRGYMIQQFVDTGARPEHYRVLTAFGIPLYMASRRAMPAADGDARSPHDPRWRLVTNSSDDVTMVRDDAILAFASAAATAIPEVPVLGMDIVREAETGRLFVLESNPFGQTWHLSSDTHARLRARTGLALDYHSQFGALRLVADELIRRVRAEAC
jgi:glutathione synthase/RimK-type ligase-like ATP-grasp enzyme